MSVLLGLPQVRSGGPAPSPAPVGAGLVDRHGRRATDLRLSVIDKCNLRCTYCMPAAGLPWLPAAQLMSPAEIGRIVDIGVSRFGVAELRLTGGEPLVRADLEEVVAAVHAGHPDLPISLTTNGIGLAGRAAALAEAGLSRINVSLDSLCAETFKQLARRDRLADVLAGAEAAAAAGLTPVKINTVLMRGVNDHEAPARTSARRSRRARARKVAASRESREMLIRVSPASASACARAASPMPFVVRDSGSSGCSARTPATISSRSRRTSGSPPVRRSSATPSSRTPTPTSRTISVEVMSWPAGSQGRPSAGMQ